jgi:hypothetical protein
LAIAVAAGREIKPLAPLSQFGYGGRNKRAGYEKDSDLRTGCIGSLSWLTHKLRQGLNEDAEHPISGFLEADEAFIGGRGDPTSPGRSTENPNKSLVVGIVEKVAVKSRAIVPP